MNSRLRRGHALDLPQEEGVKKNAPLILHQRPTKKAAKNAALPIERPGPTHADAVPATLHRCRRVHRTPPRDTRLFFLVQRKRERERERVSERERERQIPPDIFASAFGW